MLCLFPACTGKDAPEPEPTPAPEPQPVQLTCIGVSVNGVSKGFAYADVNLEPEIQLSFSVPVGKASASKYITLRDRGNGSVNLDMDFRNDDSAVVVKPSSPLNPLYTYTLTTAGELSAKNGSTLGVPVTVTLATAIDSTDKFPRISDGELLTLVQRQTFKYFWEFGHPVSGMARERTTSGNTVTTGGTGFGLMAMVVAVERGFITREQGLDRLTLIVDFLTDKADKFHGAFSHWLNGETGKTIPFSANDNGGDLVETSFLMQGLLTVGEYFKSGTSERETALCDKIQALWRNVEWDWYRRDGEDVLYWHWSPDKGWTMNHKITGWNECLITYVLAASSPTHPAPESVYHRGWARDGAMKNGTKYYGYVLPLGGATYGGPVFFAHYSFLGLNPTGLKDDYADYMLQNTNHVLINYNYCVENPLKHSGYSRYCWGLTASDGNAGYSAHSPANDKGVIAPTAALASMPYTPDESMDALRFFYYVMGDRLWKEYGFVDAFNLSANWYDSQFLAIDQGPIIVMVENYRTQLIWNLFMGNPEVREGLRKLGFTSNELRIKN